MLEGEDAVRQWEEAVRITRAFADMAANSGIYNEAMTQLLWDTAERAREFLRRTRQRVSGG